MSVFGPYARYYDLLYRDKDYRGEASYVERLIRRHHPEAGSILELGCGTGKHAQLLCRGGYDVCGIDRSEEMLKQASERAAADPDVSGRLEFHQYDIREFELGRQFDVIISLFHVISYLPTNKDLLNVFKTAASHLAKGGIMIFDCWYGPAVLTDRPSVRALRLEDDEIEVTRIAEPAMHPTTNLVDVDYEILMRDKASGAVERIRETHRMRYLFHPEIEMVLGQVGLTLVAAEEWLTGRDPGFDTWGVCFVARHE